MTTRIPLIASVLCTLAACAEPDFPVYNELEGMRVLAVRATPPDLVPGESTEIDALIYDPGGTVKRRWSLCPWPSDPNDGYTCVVDQTLWDQAWMAAGLTDAPSLALGKADSAVLSVPDDLEGLRAVCHELTAQVGASVSLPPDCEERWNWTIRLSVSADAERIETVRDVPLLLSETPERNKNPLLKDLTIEVDGARRSAQNARLDNDREVELRIRIASDQAERYTPPRALGEPMSDLTPRDEALIFTWFVEGGETDRIRTTFREGVETLSQASKNRWHTPKAQKSAALFVVVRDNRGGVDFVRGRALFTP